jgi:hypothetical protein
MTWCQTHSGGAVSFLVPKAEDISPQDIAIQISRLNRFCGATRLPYNVAQHSVHVVQIVRHITPTDYAAHLWAILHDAHEAFTGDVTTPFQQAIKLLLPTGWLDPIKVIQHRLDQAIAERFGISWDVVLEVRPIVQRADLIALATEKVQLMATEPAPWIPLPPPDNVELLPVGSANAEFLWRSELERCIAAYHRQRVAAE